MEKALSPSMLPIAKYEKKILDLIDNSPAVVISGKTGCGKSTQVPQYILNRHPNAKVVICQPRRVAATSLAVRVSEQLGCKLGKRVGYHIGMQSFKDEHCSIVYMTYGILIQQLLFKDNLQYTHIILDQIHQRSLEMDFTFVALKKIINQKYKQRIKLIVMSATLNAQLFCNYFSTNDQGNFYLCQLKQAKIVQQQSRRGGRFRAEDMDQKQNFQLIPAGKQFKPALRLELQQQKLFKIEEYYLDDLKQKDYYFGTQQQRIPQQMFTLAIDIIKQTKAQGDYLIFLPGLYQIRTLKNLLINQGFQPNQIIQVHSLFSDQLYHHLFNPNIKNKLILATNIGQSSITLPFCRVVIDFCLSRKNYSKDRGVTRLQTRLASQANMIQRSGRVGRVSDGKVYRLITKQMYQQLPQYQKPQIQCVSLQMIILRVKQLDFTNKNEIFKNPYYFLMSTINPPSIHQIRKSLQILIQQQAILGETQKSINVRNAQQLFLTQMGKFMVEMPCQLRISKMVLMGLKVRIPMKIISIACILMLSKQFFLHQERRYNIQEFMHALVGYDRGYFNDYLLRENLFSHWREEFYQKAKEKKLFKKKRFTNKEDLKIEHFHRIYQTQEGAQEVLNFLQEFNQEKWTQKQKEWCSIRGVSPNVMRELIRLQQNLRLKIISKNFKLPQKQKTYNELVLLCLQYGFPDNDCDVKWGHLNQQIQKGSNQSPYFIDIPNIKQTNDDFIDQYVRPEKDYKIQVLDNRTKRVYGNTSVLSKFILPKHYTKAQTKNTSPLYQYLSKTNLNHHFNSQFTLRCRPITILNESICKSTLPYDQNKKYKLITHRFTEIGNKKLVGTGALIQEQTFLIIQLILRKNVQLILHPSYQYFCGFRINQINYNVSTILDQYIIKDILYYRDLISQKKQTKLNTSEEMIKLDDVKILQKILRADTNQRLQREIWEYRYQIEQQGQFKEQYFHINQLPKLKTRSNYQEKYRNWKLKKYEDFYNEYRPLIMQTIYIICKKCTKEIVQIQQLSFYQHENCILKLNEYSGSWKIEQKTKILTCKYGHQIGKVLSQEQAKIRKETIMLYIPYNRIEELWDNQNWKTQKQIEDIIAKGKQEIQNIKNKIDHSQCIFCYQFINGEETPKIFERDELGKNYFKKYMDHMRNQQHLNNIIKFRKNLHLIK